MDVAVVTAISSGVAVVLAAAIPALFAYRTKRLKEDLEAANRRLQVAMNDLEFLLAVEAEFDEQWSNTWNESGKVMVRKAVKATGLEWSGRYTHSGINKMRQRLNAASK
ncbi:hypothetical protein [Aeromonas veronii]|uniref:hypothetical protein n=1 Tax=Aeromonas veronii TaxID=654 RepID=UPI000E09C364|nr:hypothetical protein [Aeromonas veronii]RDE60949.1 hypothetical protein DV708_16750 [Aeromonas veronii]